MKSIRYIIILAALALLPLSCRKGSPIPEESIITVPAQHETDFDKWLMSNFVNPYNIQFKYRYENNETDLNYYSVPTDYQSCIKMAHLVKYICLDSYDEVAGVQFTRKYFPKQFFLMGEWQYKNNGSFTLGTAEGGKKIILMGINYLERYSKTVEDLNHYYLKTIHHEFTHILNQTKDFPVTFSQVSGGTDNGYVTDDWTSDTYNDYLERGFISAYAQSEDREDFAETMALFVTNPQSWWDGQIAKAGDGGARINKKLDIVMEYMQDTFGVDLAELRSVVLRRQDEVMAGLVDLYSVVIE